MNKKIKNDDLYKRYNELYKSFSELQNDFNNLKYQMDILTNKFNKFIDKLENEKNNVNNINSIKNGNEAYKNNDNFSEENTSYLDYNDYDEHDELSSDESVNSDTNFNCTNVDPNLAKLLGLPVNESLYKTDWKPPLRPGLDNSKKIIDDKRK